MNNKYYFLKRMKDFLNINTFYTITKQVDFFPQRRSRESGLTFFGCSKKVSARPAKGKSYI